MSLSVPCNVDLSSWTQNAGLIEFIRETADRCKPRDVHVCDGSFSEWKALCESLVEAGVYKRVSKRKDCYWARSSPGDVARVEERTFICSRKQEDAGPTNHWDDPVHMKSVLHARFDGCMEGRTLFVIPFSMGPVGSKLSAFGVELTDSAYVATNMRLMTRMGNIAMAHFGANDPFVRALHSVGAPLRNGAAETSVWPCQERMEDKFIVQFPEERLIMSFGSGYGGNALLSKKCFALRIASTMARDEGWLAEHMLISGITNPEGVKRYVVAAFPSACGKTNMAMLTPTLPGWKVETVGDDIAWLRIDAETGELRAINPENGFFGVAPGTNAATNPNALASLDSECIFTNTGFTPDGDVWWEELTKEPPAGVINWRGVVHDASLGQPVAHPNARFTAPIANCPCTDPAYDDPRGVPVSAIVFGGRRPSLIPLVMESLNWNHGVLFGAMISSQQTAAVLGSVVGVPRHDPFAMLPFCGYNMGDYFKHWIEMGAKMSDERRPKIFHVNWFRRNAHNKFLWPGFGDNVRVIKWMLERCAGTAPANVTPIGILPRPEDIDLSGIDVPAANMQQLVAVDAKTWLDSELSESELYLAQFGEHLPVDIKDQLAQLHARLAAAEQQ